MKKLVALLPLVVGLSTSVAFAQSTFQAFLNGLQEVGPNASPATGFGTVVLDAAQTQITVNLNWSGLTAPATASHIHGPAGAGTNASVMFPFTGVPAATAGAIPQQTFAITPAQVGYLQNGLLYMNLHDVTFPGGEIRGQLQLAPEPSVAALATLGTAAILLAARRRKA